MKHAHEITLILPEHISLDEFQQIINISLETATDSYAQSKWSHLDNICIESNIEGRKCKLTPVATGSDRLLMEFEHNED